MKPIKKNSGQRRRGHRAVAAAERLETRLLFTAISSKAVTGDWSATSTWVGGLVPSGNDTVTIVAGAHIGVTASQQLDTLNAQVGSDLNLSGAGTLQVLDSVTGDTSTVAGSLEVGSGASINNTGTPVITISGTSTLSGALQGGKFDNSGTMTLTGGGLYGGSLVNDGTITASTGGFLMGNGAIITNNVGGTFNLTTDTGPAPTTFPGLAGGTFINMGTLNKTGGTGVYNFPDYPTNEMFSGSVFENIGGTFNINSGTFLVKGNAYLAGGAINVAANAVLMFTSPPLSVQSFPNTIGISGTVTGSGAGSIDFAQGVYQAKTPTDGAAGTLNFPAGMLTLGNVEIDEFNGSVGRNFITNAGFMNFDSATETGTIALINNGTIQNTGAGDLQFVEVTNNSAGVIDLKSNGGLASGTGNIQQNLLNKGIFRKSGGAGTSNVTAIFTETTTGTIDVESGTLNLAPISHSYYQGGVTNVAAGSTLDLDPVHTIVVGGTWMSTGAGKIQLTGGQLTGRNDTSLTTIQGPSAGVLDFAPNVFSISAGEIQGSNEGLTNSGTITVTTAVNFGTFTNSGTVIANGGTQYFFDGGITNLEGGVFEFDTDATIGLHGLFTNYGTVIKAGGTGTIDLSIFGAASYPDGTDAFRNHGAIESTSGVLIVPSDFFSAGSDGKLDVQTGATVEAVSGGTVTITPSWDDTATTITTIDGTAIIGGAGSPVPALAPLATINGTFNVQGGTSFTTAGALTNKGALTVGGNVKIHGNLTESGANSVLNFAVSGAPGSSGAPVLTVQGSTTLAGNLAATEAGGFAATLGSAYTVATFSPHATGSFASTSGVGPSFTASATAGSIILTGTGNSSGGGGGTSDLAITSVTSVPDPMTSSILNISYTVINQGTGAASGSWNDSVYLTTNGSVDNNSILLLRDGNTGGLTAGGTYTHTDIAFLPTVPVNNYQIVVLTDSGLVVPDSNRANNAGVSAPFTTSFRTLTLGAATTAQIAGVQDVAYRLTLPAGKDVSIAASFTSAYNADLFVSYGTIPTTSNFQESLISSTATSGTLVIPVHQAGDYYVLVHGREGAGGGISYTLTPTQINPGPLSITPSGIAQPVGNLTSTIKGSGFTANTTVALVSGSTTVTPGKLLLIDSDTISASFFFDFPPPGNYDVRVTTGGVTSTLPNAFFIGNGSGNGSNLTFSLVVPAASRGDLTNTAYLEYANTGFLDVPAPYFYVSGQNTSFKLEGETAFHVGSIELLGISPSGNPAVLAPGASGILPIQYTQSLIVSHQNEGLSVSQIDPAASIDLSALKTDLMPANEPADAWNVIYNNFLTMAGSTVGGLTGVLDEAATELSTQGTYTPDLSVLLRYAIQAAGGFGTVTQRFKPSIFGRGQAQPLGSIATADATGNVTMTAGAGERIFLIQPNGTYQGINGDQAVLTLVSGIYMLTEATGSKTMFNADGTLNYTQDTNGNKLTASYASGRLTSLTSANGDAFSYAYDGNGNVSQVTDPEARVTTYTYDSTGQLLMSVSSPEGPTSFTYITDPTSAAEYAISSITYPDGTHQFYTYDSMGRLKMETRDGGAEPNSYAYDALGATITTTDSFGHSSTESMGPNDTPALIGDQLGNVARLAYDSFNHETRTTSAGGFSTTTAYSAGGQITSFTDAAGNSTNFSFDPQLNQLLSLTDAGSHKTSYAYDASGNLISTTDAAGQITSYTYDSSGQITQTNSAAGRNVSVTYGAHGLVAQRSYSDGTSTTYTYDAHRNLASITDPSGTITYTYDSADHLMEVAYPNGLFLKYTNGPGGRRTQMVDQTGFTTNYAYDALGRLSQLTDGSGAVIAAYTYDAAGNLVRQDNSNGSFTVYAPDIAGEVASVVNHAADGSISSSFTYNYDADGQRTSVTSLAGTTNYAYDAVGQLVKVVLPGGRTITYAYDSTGNRTIVSDSASGNATYAVNGLNEYVTVGGTTYAYDADGNLTAASNSSGTTTYGYDARDHLVSTTTPTHTITFGYDGAGDRISTTDNGVTTRYLVDPAGTEIVGAFNSSGSVITHYTYGQGLTSAVTAGGASSFYAFDASGNTADLTGSNGAVTATYSYLPFGEILSQTGSSSQPFMFAGGAGVVSDGQGIYFMRARSYDSATGRFLQRDPQGIIVSDTNLYRYAGNDPVNHADPSGFVEISTTSGPLIEWLEERLGELGMMVGQKVRTESWQKLEMSALQNIGEALGKQESTVFVQGLAKTITEKLGAELATTTLEGEALSTLVPRLTSEAIANSAASLANLGTAMAIKQGEATVLSNVVETATTQVIAQSTVSLTTNVVGDIATDVAANLANLNSALGLGQVGYSAMHAVAEANRFNIDYPDGIPIQVQEVINPKAYADGLKRPLTSELFRNRQKLGLPISDEDILFAIKLDADLIRARNAPSNTHTNTAQTAYVNAHDPNDIIGPAGFGTAGFILGGGALPYTITFENEHTASAPAKVVTIVDQLDPNLDWTTFQLTGLGFGSNVVSVPTGLTSYHTSVDVSSALRVDISAVANVLTGAVTWTFTSIDPTTGDVPSDALAGFLPPDDAAGDGEGFISYTIKAKVGSPTGTPLHAQGTITFDGNSPISTPNILNTLDAIAPTSSVIALAATQTTSNFALSWSGQDDANGSGIASYNVYVSTDGGAFAPWITTSATSAQYVGSPGHAYAFYSTATDNAGNLEPIPSAAQAQTAVPVADRFVNFGGKTKGIYTDAQGNLVTVTLTGPGTGTLGFIGGGSADPVYLVVTGTTARSALTVRAARGTTTLTGVEITGSLAKFSAKSANLTGSFDVTGTLGAITLNSVNSGPATITVEGSGASTFTFGILQDLSLTTAGTIKSLSATSWTDGAFASDALTAAALGKLSIKGGFDANMSLTSGALSATLGSITGGTWGAGGSIQTLTSGTIASSWNATVTGNVGPVTVRGDLDGSLTAQSIKSLKVTGSLNSSTITLTGTAATLRRVAALGSFSVTGSFNNSTVNAAGNIGAVSVGGMSGSNLFAGVAARTIGLPTAGALSDASILSFIAGGKSPFANSNVAAKAIGAVTLRNVTPDNGGTPFGVAATSLKSFALLQPKQKPVLWHAKQSTAVFNSMPGDLKVQLL